MLCCQTKAGINITEQMLQASIHKALALGVLPRRHYQDALATNVEIMQEILQAAFDTLPPSASETVPPDEDGALSQ